MSKGEGSQLEDEGTDQNMGLPDVSEFGKFIKNWLPVILAIVVGFSVVAIGDIVRNQSEHDRKNAPPEVHANFSHCKILDKQTVSFRMMSFYINTSCGNFQITEDLFVEAKKGEVYDLETIRFAEDGPSYVTYVKASS